MQLIPLTGTITKNRLFGLPIQNQDAAHTPHGDDNRSALDRFSAVWMQLIPLTGTITNLVPLLRSITKMQLIPLTGTKQNKGWKAVAFHPLFSFALQNQSSSGSSRLSSQTMTVS